MESSSRRMTPDAAITEEERRRCYKHWTPHPRTMQVLFDECPARRPAVDEAIRIVHGHLDNPAERREIRARIAARGLRRAELRQCSRLARLVDRCLALHHCRSALS